jgi:hypothetical protein
LPPSKEPYTQLQCVLKTHLTPPPLSTLPAQPSVLKATGPTQSSSVSVCGSSDFLSNLLDKVILIHLSYLDLIQTKANSVRSQVAKESVSTASTSLNSTAVTILQRFEDDVRRQLSELSSLEDGLGSPEIYRLSFPPMEKEQRYIMSHIPTPSLPYLCSFLSLLFSAIPIVMTLSQISQICKSLMKEKASRGLTSSLPRPSPSLPTCAPSLPSHTVSGTSWCIGMDTNHQMRC